jgi:hypothetical protein
VWAGTYAKNSGTEDEPKYLCQATQLPYFTTLLPWWDVRQYVEDYSSGNVTLARMLRGFIYAAYFNVSNAGIKVGRPMRWLYDKCQALWGGVPFPRRAGKIPAGQPTPATKLDLQTGELVRVKSYRDILETLDTDHKNRGLWFDAEHVPYCGGIYRVRSRVSKFINEKSGKMVKLKTDAVILENIWCQARYSNCRLFCPRSIYPWWREIWLERVPEISIKSEMKVRD